MRHQVGGKKLSRDANHRKDLLKTMVSQLLINGKLTTTETKAKIVQSTAERLLNKAKENTVHVQRQLMVSLGNAKSTKIAVTTMAGELKDKTGGFIKAVRLGRRLGDNTMMVRLELPVKKEEVKKEEKSEAKAKKTTKSKSVKKA